MSRPTYIVTREGNLQLECPLRIGWDYARRDGTRVTVVENDPHSNSYTYPLWVEWMDGASGASFTEDGRFEESAPSSYDIVATWEDYVDWIARLPVRSGGVSAAAWHSTCVPVDTGMNRSWCKVDGCTTQFRWNHTTCMWEIYDGHGYREADP